MQGYTVFKRDISRGFMRVQGSVIADHHLQAPLVCIPFELKDKTSIDPLAQKAIWAITNVESSILRGNNGAFIENIPGFHFVSPVNAKKKCIITKDLSAETEYRQLVEDASDGENSLSSVEQVCTQNQQQYKTMLGLNTDGAMKEIEIEMRIHKAKRAMRPSSEENTNLDEICDLLDNEEDRNDKVEYFVVLIVRSPLAFSFRTAVSEDLEMRLKTTDSQFVDERRSVWNELATHVREGTFWGLDDAGRTQYTSRDIGLSLDVRNTDWINLSNEDSFTSLFSIEKAVDWMRNKYFFKYPDLEYVDLEGFGTLSKSEALMGPTVISRYVEYDTDVQEALLKNAAARQKESKQRKRKMNDPLDHIPASPHNAMLVVRNSAASESGSTNGEIRISIRVPTSPKVIVNGRPLTSKGKLVTGYPACEIALHVVPPASVEHILSFRQFEGHIKSFPVSVILSILKNTLLMDTGNDAFCDLSSGNGSSACFHEDETVGLGEIQSIVCGRDMTMDRPMLANGDASWARHCKEGLVSFGVGQEMMKYNALQKYIRLGFGLAMTRAMGSDNYVNERVHCYGKYIEHNGGKQSSDDCKGLYDRIVENSGRVRRSDLFSEALFIFGECMHQCNLCDWNLRPDNVFYMINLLVSDMMLCLNFHDSSIEGACNGIGATIIIRDGGGSYRKWFRNSNTDNFGNGNLGQIFAKRYGAGADMVIGKYKNVSDIGMYNELFRPAEPFICELKRTTEMGLLQDSCNITEYHGSEKKQVHVATNTMTRKYSTELKAGNDTQSQCCMQAITWLIPRNTIGNDVNIFKTTREHEKTKARINVEYRQVTNGYWVICSNRVDANCRERFSAITAVSRNLVSSANALPLSTDADTHLPGWAGSAHIMHKTVQRVVRGVPDKSTRIQGCERSRFIDFAMPVFFSGMCTSVLAGFMQWTGSLGKIPCSYVLDALISVFYVQLEQSKDILNPDMFNSGNKMRSLQICRARGVAASLFFNSFMQNIESGRLGLGYREAVERVAMQLTIESASPSIAPWMMADTLEHLYRLDFVILMQMLCTKLCVPSTIVYSDLILWLKTGSCDHCQVLKDWIASKTFVHSSACDLRRRGTELTDTKCCMYITGETGMACVVSESNTEVDATVHTHFGSLLYRQFRRHLEEYCQIVDDDDSEQIVRAMLVSCVNKQMCWPGCFGNIETLPNFWMDNVPTDEEKIRLMLSPIRYVAQDSRKVSVCVDVRWLLLIHCTCGSFPSQSSRYNLIGKWISEFYRLCVPKYMRYSTDLFTGMPSAYMHGGFVVSSVHGDSMGDSVVDSNTTCMLRRPLLQLCYDEQLEIVGMDAPVNTGVVEDMGPAFPRYELAKVLNVQERTLSTSSVSTYALPIDIWIPVLVPLEGRGEMEYVFCSMKINYQETVYTLMVDGKQYDITNAPDNVSTEVTSGDGRRMVHIHDIVKKVDSSFLNGRVIVDVRPLCLFFRPGILLKTLSANGGYMSGVVTEYDYSLAKYTVLGSDGICMHMTSHEVEDSVVRVKSPIFCTVRGLELSQSEVEARGLFFFKKKECGSLQRMESGSVSEDDLIECQLSLPREDLQDAYNRACFTGNGYITVMINWLLDTRHVLSLSCTGTNSNRSVKLINVHVDHIVFRHDGEDGNVFNAVSFQ